MKRYLFALICATSPLSLMPIESADAAVVAKVSVAQQRMEVIVDGTVVHTWPVSTGREDFDTPTGTYTTQWLDRDHRSQKYDDAPMPYAVFFRGGYAVHGTTSLGMLGRRASHGCVRLSTANARQFYELVQAHGLASSKVVIEHGQRDQADRRYVAEIRAKNHRDDDAETPVRRVQAVAREPVYDRGTARGYANSAHRTVATHGQPILVYQLGANGQLIPVGYRRF